MWGQRRAPAALYPRERPGTHCKGGWVGPRVGLDRCGNSSPPPPGFNPRTVQPVASRYADYATRPTVSTECCLHFPFSVLLREGNHESPSIPEINIASTFTSLRPFFCLAWYVCTGLPLFLLPFDKEIWTWDIAHLQRCVSNSCKLTKLKSTASG